MGARVVWSGSAKIEPSYLGSIEHSLELLLRARARAVRGAPGSSPLPQAASRATRHRKVLRRWAREAGLPEHLADAVVDGLFDPLASHIVPGEEGVTVRLAAPDAVPAVRLDPVEGPLGSAPLRFRVHLG